MAHRIRRQLSVIVFLVLAGATGGASAAHAQTLPPSCTGFTDDPLQAGVTVKAQHLTELRACVDALRVQAGLAALTWTDLTLQAGATWIRAVHIAELRTALGAVYTAHGETGPAYTDPALTAQATLVRAAHVTEIRTAILVVAGVCEPETCSNDGPIDQAIEYYHLDALGSVRAVSDEVGDVVRRHDYFPFGEGVSAIDGYVLRYAEQEGDPESGLSYVGARYYRAWTGRFTTVDPGHVGGDLFNPQSWNAYAYALNNPVTFTDPTGLAAEGTRSGCPAGHYCESVTVVGHAGGGPGLTPAQEDFLRRSSDPLQGMDRSDIPDHQRRPGGGRGSSLLDGIQAALDVVSVAADTTGAGASVSWIPDVVNAVISLARGDVSGAGLSAAATIPAVGLSSNLARLVRTAPESSLEAAFSAATSLYPKKATTFELHHIVPQYLGGAADGPMIRLPAAYHQLITNEFRSLHPYGSVRPTPTELDKILRNVYWQYPLPGR